MATLTKTHVDTLPEFREAPIGETVAQEIEEIVSRPSHKIRYVWAGLRLSMGWIFFWAFIDKLFGLGFATGADGAWLAGGSPTFGFLSFGTDGPLAGMYQGMAGNVVVDWMFMLGLLAIGLPLLLGIGVRLAAAAGVIMMLLMYTAASLLPDNNPFMDDHLVYAVIMIGLAVAGAGKWLGLGKPWANTRLVRKYPILE
jgi:thiosulfate dehydrogenase [quinone] large subunit